MKTNSSIFLFRDAAARRAANCPSGLAHAGRQAVASALMFFLVPLSIGDIYAQDAPPPPPADYNGQGSAYQPLSPEDLNRLVAPIALYPDSLVAQALAASTYPAQVASAEQFVRENGGAPPEQLAQMADQQPWDPSVKALTAFPQVLQNMNQNMQWTTQLGNAYYNQPQDVMTAVQSMRQQAYSAGSLRPSPQLNVEYNPGAIVIAPVNPEVVYVPYYNPWVVYGAPIAPWGYYHYFGPPPGVVLGVGLALGFGIGIGIGVFGGFGWGFHAWAPNWGAHTVVFNHNTYISNSVTVVNHGNYGGFDRNPQARAFNHTQAARFANVNHTTINNVSVNRTNVNNMNRNGINDSRSNVNNGSVRNNFNANSGRPGAPTAAQQGGFNPRTQQNFNRGTQPGQFNGGARPAQPNGQFNGARPAAQPGQFNGGARPAAQSGQFSGGARPGGAQPSAARSNPSPARPQPQQQHASQPHSAPRAESHGGGEHHH